MAYLSNSRPDFRPFTFQCGEIPAYRFSGNLKTELESGRLTRLDALELLEDMLMVREVEEMIVRIRGGSMHIADFSVGHLGANAIVGGYRMLLCRGRGLFKRGRAGIVEFCGSGAVFERIL